MCAQGDVGRVFELSCISSQKIRDTLFMCIPRNIWMIQVY